MEEYIKLEIAEFDALARDEQFIEGPFISTHGDNYGDPYMPWRRVYGRLKDGRLVESEKHYK